jgi:hypothetical protein
MKTSGLIYSLHSDGSASIGYEDYGVEIFGGSDYEVTYLLNKENVELLLKHLSVSSAEDAEPALIREFGEHFNSIRFEAFCHQHGIEFLRNIYIS